MSYAGERWDFVLEATQDIGNYWIRFTGLMDCDERFKKAHQVAILHYNGSTFEEPTGPVGYNIHDKRDLVIIHCCFLIIMFLYFVPFKHI